MRVCTQHHVEQSPRLPSLSEHCCCCFSQLHCVVSCMQDREALIALSTQRSSCLEPGSGCCNSALSSTKQPGLRSVVVLSGERWRDMGGQLCRLRSTSGWPWPPRSAGPIWQSCWRMWGPCDRISCPWVQHAPSPSRQHGSSFPLCASEALLNGVLFYSVQVGASRCLQE